MTGNSYRKLAPGFTVIEMLVTITIFSFVAVILSQTFISFNRLHRKIANTAVLGQDARFAMEMLTREGRNKLVDYAGGVLPVADTQLSLVSKDGASHVQVAMKIPADAVCEDLSVNCLALSTDGGLTWNTITSKHVNVKQFDVMVRPLTDPFAPGASGNQPFITVVMTLEYLADNPQDNASLQTQTTVSSRIYLK